MKKRLEKKLEQCLSQLNPTRNSSELKPYNLEEQHRIATLIFYLVDGASKETKIGNSIDNMLRHFLWYATSISNEGKNSPYENQPLWTRAAITSYLNNKISNYPYRTKNLRHEHSIPIQQLKLKIWEDPNNIKTLLSKCSIAVVVTKEEDAILNKHFKSNLPMEFDWEKPNILLRYTLSSINEIYDIRESDLLTQLIKSNKREFEQLIK